MLPVMQTPSVGRIVHVPFAVHLDGTWEVAGAMITKVHTYDVPNSFLINVRVLADDEMIPERRTNVLLLEEAPEKLDAEPKRQAWWPPRV